MAVTDNPLMAIVIVTIIDLLGYAPTFRKAARRPFEEMPMHFVISNGKHFASFFAMTTYSWTTMLCPAALFAMNFILISAIYWWRAREKGPDNRPALSSHRSC